MTLTRLIPSELLAKIFEHASETGWARAPIVVSHVCSTWRAAAQSHPGVWSRLTVKLDMRNPVSWIKHCLSMARRASLHITIIHTASTTLLGQVMALLLERSEQWVSLTLDLHFADTRQVLTACTGRFTKLRSIGLSLVATDESIEAAEGTTGFANAFQDAPALTSVSIVGNVLPRDLPPRITSLRIECGGPSGSSIDTPRSVVEALRNLPDLEILSLRLGEIATAPLDIPEIELPKLKTLTFEDLQSGAFQILNYLTASSLTHLSAHAQSLPDMYGPPFYSIRFLEGSPKLETLEFGGVEIWSGDWFLIFSLLPKLRKLYLHDSDIGDEVIERMFGKDGLCPDLQQIDLRWCQHVRGTTLVRLVESRLREGGREIEEVAAICCSLVNKQDAMQLAGLTTFRVIGERDKHCREFGFLSHVFTCLTRLRVLSGERKCCNNKRYRRRLKFHLLTLPKEERAGIRLVVD